MAFAERVIALLDQGSFSSTYKFAVLLALIDLCCEGADRNGRPPDNVTTVQLAEAVMRVYWRQTHPYTLGSEPLLSQNSDKTKPPIILKLIHDFRGRADRLTTWFEAQREPGYERLRREVERTLVEMPLPKLQRFGNQDERFIYEIAWDDKNALSLFRDPAQFDNRIRFVVPAAEHLVRLSGLLRPLIQEKWTRKVADLNHLPEGNLIKFLFDTDRTALVKLRGPLVELQSGCCFYCNGKLAPRITHVDHFIPWARTSDDGIDNLVAADASCNGAKRDFLPGIEHVDKWARRYRERGSDLTRIVEEVQWFRHPERTLGIVRASFLGRNRELQRLWQARDSFEASDQTRLKALLVGL